MNQAQQLLVSNFDQARITRVPITPGQRYITKLMPLTTGCYRLLVDGKWLCTIRDSIEDEATIIANAIERGIIKGTA